MQFVFDDEALEVLIKSKGDEAEESENKFVGGQNRWRFDAFTNWEFWWKKFPVLVYFKVCREACILYSGLQLQPTIRRVCLNSVTT